MKTASFDEELAFKQKERDVITYTNKVRRRGLLVLRCPKLGTLILKMRRPYVPFVNVELAVSDRTQLTNLP